MSLISLNFRVINSLCFLFSSETLHPRNVTQTGEVVKTNIVKVIAELLYAPTKACDGSPRPERSGSPTSLKNRPALGTCVCVTSFFASFNITR